MIKREFKINLKSLLIWFGVCIFLYGIVFAIYPSIMNSDNISKINEIMKVFPEDILKAFNFDMTSIETAFGWFKSEGYIYLVLISSIYAAILGSNILLKEESDKTIEYLYSKPINRNKIVTSKIICGITNIILIILGTALFNIIGISIIGDYNFKIMLILSLVPLLTVIPIFLFIMFISTFFNKTKRTTPIALGIALMEYFLFLISSLSENAAFLKYFTVFSLSDSRYILEHSQINFMWIIISLGISFIFTFLIHRNYNKKELL